MTTLDNVPGPAAARPRRKTTRRVLFVSDLPCRSAALSQISRALGHDVTAVQRPARQLVGQPRMLEGYSVAVVHPVPFDLVSRVLAELSRAGVTTVLVPRYQGAEETTGDSRPKVVGYRPMTTPAFAPADA